MGACYSQPASLPGNMEVANVAIHVDYDLNHDGKVNVRELVLFKEFRLYNDLRGDFNGDGVVDDTDRKLLIAAIMAEPNPGGASFPPTYIRVIEDPLNPGKNTVIQEPGPPQEGLVTLGISKPKETEDTCQEIERSLEASGHKV